MKITLANGMTVEGTQEQIREVMEKFGYKGIGGSGYYYSDTKGPVLIINMNSMHLRNAILKYYKDWVDELHAEENPKKVVMKILAGINDPTWIAMVKELSERDMG